MNTLNVLKDLRNEFNEMPCTEVVRYNSFLEKEFKTFLYTQEHWDFLHQRYYNCVQVWKVLGEKTTFDEFKDYIVNGNYAVEMQVVCEKERQTRWKISYWGRKQAAKNSRNSFTQHGIKKKFLSGKEKLKRERQRKKRKDRSCRYGCKRGPGKSYKTWAAKTHRAYEKACIDNSRYCDLHNRSYQTREGYYWWW